MVAYAVFSQQSNPMEAFLLKAIGYCTGSPIQVASTNLRDADHFAATLGDNMPNQYATAELTCKSCQQIYNPSNMSWSRAEDDSITGTAICDICEPWVEYSGARTNKLPVWAKTLVHDEPQIIEETRAALEKIVGQNYNAQWGPRGLNGRPHQFQIHNHLGPHNDWAWLEFIEWCVGLGHPEIIQGFNHAEAREGDAWMSDELDTVASITEWFDHIREERRDTNNAFSFTSEEGFIYAETHTLGEHEIIVHDTIILVDGVEFDDRSGENYWLDPEVLPELLFDSIHDLDSRPIDFRAELYSLNTQCLQFIGQVGNIRAPQIPYIRELVNRLSHGDFEMGAARRFHAALILWSSHPEREFHTCSREPWAKSFTLVREIVSEIPSEVRVDPAGLLVEGSSGNLYRISPPSATGWIYDGFEIRTASRISDEVSAPICIHTAMQTSHLPMGDIIASLILMLRDDIESAKSIGPLRAMLPDSV